jgi:hypothetical protein
LKTTSDAVIMNSSPCSSYSWNSTSQLRAPGMLMQINIGDVNSTAMLSFVGQLPNGFQC